MSGKVATAGILAHLRRLLLDDDLMRPYTDGEAIKLFDQIMRAMYPPPVLQYRPVRPSTSLLGRDGGLNIFLGDSGVLTAPIVGSN